MAKMNKTQLEHLEGRLNFKVTEIKQKHPLSKAIAEIDAKIKKLSAADQPARIALVKTLGKQSLKQIVLDQITHGHGYGSTLTDSLNTCPERATRTALIQTLEKEKKALKTKLTEAMKPIQAQRIKVFDAAVFADSGEEILAAIEGFMSYEG